MHRLTKQDLIQFEAEIAAQFEQAKIRGPVHLADGNEDQLIEIFKRIRPDDWVFSTWRSHYHALLHGIDKDWLRQKIMAGESITVTNRQHRFFSSAIVGGTCPIALGVALALKRQQADRHVWVFVGDMTAETGAFHEALKYAQNFDLPLTFVIEDNGIITTTPTPLTWGRPVQEQPTTMPAQVADKVWRYSYKKTKYPHQGIGKWIQF
jgi:pyruvate dehydrogenase E1 component alpha subunit